MEKFTKTYLFINILAVSYKIGSNKRCLEQLRYKWLLLAVAHHNLLGSDKVSAQKTCIVLEKFTETYLFLNILAVSYKIGSYKRCLEQLRYKWLLLAVAHHYILASDQVSAKKHV